MNPLWCNGQWLETCNFPASVTDRGMTLGLGLFETMLGVDGDAVFAGRHLERLHAGCERLGWHLELPEFRPLLRELLQRNDLATGRSRIRLAISGGSGPLGELALGADHRVWLTAVPAPPPASSTTAILSPWPRNERSPLAGLKCASYAENLIALAHASRLGFEESVILNTAGRLCEAATANLFLVKNGGLLTPSLASGCLPGITRSIVIELAAQLGLACEESELSVADLHAADELFLTSSIRGPQALARFEGKIFPEWPVTRVVGDAWQAATRNSLDS